MNKSSLTSKQRPGYIWDPSRVVQYESIFSILSKFAQQNFATPADIWHLFGKEIKSKKSGKIYTPLLNLNYENKFEPVSLCEGLGLNKATYNFTHIFPYIPDIKYHNLIKRKTNVPIFRKAIEDDLRYCPICLSNGFHTPMFQAKWVHTCPVHKVPLQTHCEYCGKTKPYRLERQTLSSLFGCNCNRSIYKHKNDTENYAQLTSEIRDCIKLYLDWLHGFSSDSKMSCTQIGLGSSQYFLKNLHDGYYYFTEYWVNIFPPDKKILQMLHPENCIGESYGRLYESKVQLKKTHTVPASHYLEQPDYLNSNINSVLQITDLYDIFEPEKDTIKSHCLGPHLKCIEQIRRIIDKKGLVNYSFICPYAFAFILWEMYWKNAHADIISPNKTTSDFARHQHFGVLTEYYYRLIHAFDVQELLDAQQETIWIISELFKLYLISSLDCVLDFSLRTERSEPGHPISPDFITSDNNPYFYLENSKGGFKFVAWNDHIEDKLKERMVSDCDTFHANQVSQYVSALLNKHITQRVEGIYALTQCCQDVLKHDGDNHV